jgi:hypothetical protein
MRLSHYIPSGVIMLPSKFLNYLSLFAVHRSYFLARPLVVIFSNLFLFILYIHLTLLISMAGQSQVLNYFDNVLQLFPMQDSRMRMIQVQ